MHHAALPENLGQPTRSPPMRSPSSPPPAAHFTCRPLAIQSGGRGHPPSVVRPAPRRPRRGYPHRSGARRPTPRAKPTHLRPPTFCRMSAQFPPRPLPSSAYCPIRGHPLIVVIPSPSMPHLTKHVRPIFLRNKYFRTPLLQTRLVIVRPPGITRSKKIKFRNIKIKSRQTRQLIHLGCRQFMRRCIN